MSRLSPHMTKIWLVAACAGALLLHLFSDQLDGYFVNVVINIGITVILAVSLNLVNGHTGQFSLGHAGFMAVGAYCAAAITTVMTRDHPAWAAFMAQHHNLVFLLALIAGGLSAAVVGLLVGIPSLRLRGDYLAIVTLGFGEIIRVLLENNDYLGEASGIKGIAKETNLFWTYAFAAITIYTVGMLVSSTYGLGFLATRDDEIAAESVGVNTTRSKVVAFITGAFFAGIAGGLFAHHNQFLSPGGFTFTRSVEIVVIVILGGMGNTLGVALAAVVLTVLMELLRQYQDYRMVVYSLLIILLMLLRPQGLFGTWKGKRKNRVDDRSTAVSSL